MRAALLYSVATIAIVIAGCEAASDDLPNIKTPSLGGSDPQTAASAAPAGAPAGASAGPSSSVAKIPLPDLTPVLAAKISSPRQVLNAGPFTGQRPSVRANDRHSFGEVTGKDCMTCHGTGGTAPHFAFGGTIALGKQWTWGTPTWSTGRPSGNAYGSYDSYGSYDTGDYGSFGGLLGGGSGSYGDYDTGGYGYDDGYGGGGRCGGGGGYDDDGYDTGGYGFGLGDLLGGGGGYGSYGDDDDDYGGGGGCGMRGWPADRTNPSPYTGVRIVGSDGYVFDTVTDDDGNFWFKTPADVVVPAYTGIRYGTFTVTGDTNGIACASCHESGKPDSPGRLWTWDGPTPRR